MSLQKPIKNIRKTKLKKSLIKKGIIEMKGDKEKKIFSNFKRLNIVRKRYTIFNILKLLKKRKLKKVFKNKKKIISNFRKKSFSKVRYRKPFSTLLEKWLKRIRAWSKIKKEHVIKKKVKKKSSKANTYS
jgi:hypothetical protein